MAPSETERRLAAILAADVVGFSRQMGADEAATLARIAALRADVLDPLLAEHRGLLFNTMGDGVLAEAPQRPANITLTSVQPKSSPLNSNVSSTAMASA